MPEWDESLSHFLGREETLADFVNGIVYKGNKIIHRDQVLDVQRAYEVNLHERCGGKKILRRKRDVIKAIHRNGHFVIFAVELQKLIHYFMPLRVTEYDLCELLRQREEQVQRHLQESDLQGAQEYLSKGKQGERITPVVTIVLNLGERWDAARSLYELYDMEAVDEVMRPMLLNHELNVVELTQLDENCFETGLRELIGLMKRKDDKKAMLAFYEENQDRFREMDAEAFDVICRLLNMKQLLKLRETKKTEIERKRGKVDMCRAFDEILQDKKEEGIRIGEKTGEVRGEKRGEKRMRNLIGLLMKDGRTEDVLSAAQSVSACRKLYQEYGI